MKHVPIGPPQHSPLQIPWLPAGQHSTSLLVGLRMQEPAQQPPPQKPTLPSGPVRRRHALTLTASEVSFCNVRAWYR